MYFIPFHNSDAVTEVNLYITNIEMKSNNTCLTNVSSLLMDMIISLV